MIRTQIKWTTIMFVMFGLAIATVLMMPLSSIAKDNNQNHTRFYGWVESRPEGLHGTWIIGGRQIKTHPQTEFDQEEGPLIIGRCAKIEFRDRIVHEIDSEPPHDCQ